MRPYLEWMLYFMVKLAVSGTMWIFIRCPMSSHFNFIVDLSPTFRWIVIIIIPLLIVGYENQVTEASAQFYLFIHTKGNEASQK